MTHRPARRCTRHTEAAEDRDIAATVRERYAHDDGTRVTVEELTARMGWDPEEIAAEVDRLANELGLPPHDQH